MKLISTHFWGATRQCGRYNIVWGVGITWKSWKSWKSSELCPCTGVNKRIITQEGVWYISFCLQEEWKSSVERPTIIRYRQVDLMMTWEVFPNQMKDYISVARCSIVVNSWIWTCCDTMSSNNLIPKGFANVLPVSSILCDSLLSLSDRIPSPLIFRIVNFSKTNNKEVYNIYFLIVGLRWR